MGQQKIIPMVETLKITSILVIAFVVANPGPVSIGVSLLFGFYILNMFYFNVVRKYYGGSWKRYAQQMLRRFLRRR